MWTPKGRVGSGGRTSAARPATSPTPLPRRRRRSLFMDEAYADYLKGMTVLRKRVVADLKRKLSDSAVLSARRGGQPLPEPQDSLRAFISHQGSLHCAESMRSLRGVRSPDAHATHDLSQRGALGEWIVLRTRTQVVLEQLDLAGAEERRRHERLLAACARDDEQPPPTHGWRPTPPTRVPS